MTGRDNKAQSDFNCPQIERILRHAKKAKNGRIQHYFLAGSKKQRISLALNAGELINHYYGMRTVYVSNKNSTNLKSFLDSVIGAMLMEFPTNSLKDKIQLFFQNHGEFKSDNFISDDYLYGFFKQNFEDFLLMIYSELPESSGIFLIIDDVGGLSASHDFVNWYKRFSDVLTVNEITFPFYMFFTSSKNHFHNLALLDESFARIFDCDEISTP